MDKFEEAVRILREGMAIYKPYAVVAMVSGGDDSLTAYAVAKAAGIPIDYIMHGNTRTGIKSTTQHVRNLAEREGIPYLEADAGSAYEDYVLRKGFFGVGSTAHTYAYHILKKGPFSKTLSKYIRQRKRGRNILLINGARKDESANRRSKLEKEGPFRHMGTKTSPNIWVSPIMDWTKKDCLDFLRQEGIERCPAAIYCHRSGECLCGTMQSKQQAEEVSFWFPDWGKWKDDIERRVKEAGFSWGWGETYPKKQKPKKTDGMPMCSTCVDNRPEGID